MSSEALSEQSCVREGAGYNEVFPSSQDDPDTFHDERVPSANSSSTEEDEDLDVDGLEGDSNDEEDIGSVEPPFQSVIGPNGLREFIMLLLWTINEFNSSIKQNTSVCLGRNTRFPLAYQSIYPSSLKSVTTRVLKTSKCTNRC